MERDVQGHGVLGQHHGQGFQHVEGRASQDLVPGAQSGGATGATATAAQTTARFADPGRMATPGMAI